MKKNYIYKVNASGEICVDLQTAIKQAYNGIVKSNGYYYEDERISKPFTAKVRGGYLVIVITYDGNIFQRRIDVFTATKTKTSKYIVDQTHNKIKGYKIEDDTQNDNEKEYFNDIEEDDDYDE